MSWCSLSMSSQIQFDTTVTNILNEARYRHLRNPIREFYENAKEVIGEFIYNLLVKTFSSIPNPAEISKNISTIFMILGIVAIAVIIIIVILKINKTLEKRGRIREILGERIDENTTPNSLRIKAEELYKVGDYRAAIRFEFIGLLLLMHEKNVVYLDDTKTNKEIYDYLKKKAFVNMIAFEYLSNTFNSSWYGHKTTEEEGLKAWSSNINLLWDEVKKYEDKDK